MAIKESLPLLDRRTYKKGKSGPNYVKFVCSGIGKPTHARSFVERERTGSRRVDCNRASFTVGPINVRFNLEHVPECKPLTQDELAQLRLDLRVPKHVEEGTIKDMIPSLESERTKDFDIKDRARRYLTENGYADAATDSYLARVFRKAKIAVQKLIPPTESVSRMITTLKDDNIPHMFKSRTLNGKKTVDAIHMRIPQLTGASHKTPFYVYSADVTHKVVDPATGFTKLSMISGISPGHSVFPQVESLIVSENIETFVSELTFLLNEDISLASRPVIFLVDGDDGRITAIKSMLPKARVYLCLWHKQQNVISKATPSLTALQGPKQTKQQLLDQLHALGLRGNKNENVADLQSRLEEHLQKSAEAASPGAAANASQTSNDESDLEEYVIDDEDTSSNYDAEESDLESVGDNTSSRAQEFPEMTSLTHITARRMFQWLQTAWDEVECDKRLNQIVIKLPKLADYVNRELRSNKYDWAEFARVWGLTFNLNTSTIQENAQWSIKSQLRGKSVMAHRFVQFMIDIFSRRQSRITKRLSALRSISHLAESARQVHKSFAGVVEQTLSREGQQLIFKEFDRAQAYSWAELTTPAEIRAAIPLERRGASAKRFSMLISDQVPLEGRYFKVTHLDKRTHDIVHVFANGSIACTCGRFASSGAPDHHFFVLLRSKQVAFNPIAHVHPAYFASSIAFGDAFTVPTDLKHTVNATASWQTAVEASKEQWTKEGMGGFIGSIVPISPSRLETRPQTLADKAIKLSHLIRDIGSHDAELLEEIQQVLDNHMARVLIKDVRKIDANGETLQLPIASRRTTSKRARMSADYIASGSKRKPRKKGTENAN